MKSDFEELKRIIFCSDLSTSDKRAFFVFLKNAKRDELRKIIDLFNEYPEYIGIVYRFAILKSKAAKEQDVKAFKAVIKEEITFLEKIKT